MNCECQLTAEAQSVAEVTQSSFEISLRFLCVLGVSAVKKLNQFLPTQLRLSFC